MQQPAAQTMNSAPPPPFNVVTTEQIQKYLDENKNLIVAIMENQNMGKIAECARYQAILQKNLVYLATIADAQPQGSTMPSQLPTSSMTPQENSPMLQTQAPMLPQQSPFQLNALWPQEQQNQLLQFQQQQQLPAHSGAGARSGLHLSLQPGVSSSGGSVAFRGSQPSCSYGDNQGNSSFGPAEGRE